MKHFWVVFCLLASINSTAQVFQDFEDSLLHSWNQHPSHRWQVSNEQPITGSFSLKHSFDNATSDRDRISFPVGMDFTQHQVKWRLQVKYDYNPSGSNNWGFFLMSDANSADMHPSGLANGYLVGVNYSGSDDILKLWKITGGSGYELVNTGFNWQDEITPGTPVGLEVVRTSTGNWQIRVDKNGGFDELIYQGEAENLDYNECNHIGVFYEYTSSADSKLWMDDISVQWVTVDNTAPVLLKDSLLGDDRLFLSFSESMESSSLLDTTSYTLNGKSHPSELSPVDSSLSSVVATFERSFSDSVLQQLSMTGLTDEQGNRLADTVISFRYQKLHITSLQVIADNILKLRFSDTADTISLLVETNYGVEPGSALPDSAAILSNNPATVLLFFAAPFTPFHEYTLKVKGILDRYLETMDSQTIPFVYREAGTNDVVITEIMADPSPRVSLPEVEFLEIVNLSGETVDLSSWQIKTPAAYGTFPAFTMEPGEYFIVCEEENLTALSDYGNTIGLKSLPALTNSGTTITLSDSTGRVMHQVEYADDWYREPDKADGGWSLEKIDPRNHCSGKSNWKASEDHRGGTPGAVNSVDSVNMDHKPPYPLHFSVVSANQVQIKFSEPLHPALEDSNRLFRIDPVVGHPFSILRETDQPQTLKLLFTEDFIQNGQYTLHLEDIYDRCLNDTSLSIPFTYHEVQPYDVLINEVMMDPEPAVKLPESEYIELYNRSGYPISLEGWKIIIGQSERSIPAATLPDNKYLLLCGAEDTSIFAGYGTVLGIKNMSSINNNGELVVIEDHKGQVVDMVDIKAEWHKRDYQREGGWSLEQIDPMNPCGEKTNWSTSSSNQGGTPGKVNAIHASNPDQEPLKVDYLFYIDSARLAIHFTEACNRKTGGNKALYNIPGGGATVRAELLPPLFKTVILTFSKSFEPSKRYTLLIDQLLKDCAGNHIGREARYPFEVPQQAQFGDLVINEILFNPLPGGSDFVELYNRSGKTIALSGICLSNEEDHVHCQDDLPLLIFPSSYLVLTEDASTLKQQYHVPYPARIREVEHLPGLGNKEGILTLYDKSLEVIDHLEYTEEMHFPLLNSTEGVSLERIHFSQPSNRTDNWHSASEQSGYATPGYQNSQYTENSGTESRFHVEPEVFSPDNDGHDDILSVQYLLPKPGQVASIKIFDARGRLVRTLLNNKTLNTEGTIRWNGLTDNNRKASTGIYVIYIEIFDLEGRMEVVKKRCVVAG